MGIKLDISSSGKETWFEPVGIEAPTTVIEE
jgi:hypothetical protein